MAQDLMGVSLNHNSPTHYERIFLSHQFYTQDPVIIFFF